MSEQEPYTPSDDEVMTDYLNMQSLIGDESDIDANYQAVLRWGRWLAAHDAEVARAAAEKALFEFSDWIRATKGRGQMSNEYEAWARAFAASYRLEQTDEQ